MRVKETLMAAQAPDQARFRPGYSCDDLLFAITLLAEKMLESNLPLWVVAVDFMKAFDTISHDGLLEALREQSAPGTYIHVLQKLYQNQTGFVQTDKTSVRFGIDSGTKQGDRIS